MIVPSNNFWKIGDKKKMLLIESIERTKSANNRVKTLVYCLCDCGERRVFDFYKFIASQSCGCNKGNFKYGGYDKKVYSTWRSMKKRCFWDGCPNYFNYGGRGITVCNGFMDFLFFQKTIGVPPTKRHSVDRIDNSANYSCGKCWECEQNGWAMNVRWATAKEQSENKRNNYNVDVNGKLVTLKEACRLKNLPYKQVHERIKRGGWDIQTAINTPVSKDVWVRYKNIKHEKTS